MAKKDNNKDKKKNNFFKELKTELKKVTWPTSKKLVNNTSAVIAVVLIVAIVVFILDVCFENLNKFGVEKLKALVSTDAEDIIENESENTIDLEENIESIPSNEETSDELVLTEETNTDSESIVNSEEEVTQ